MQIGDTVNLIRKITNEVLPMTLDVVLVHGNQPIVEVYWKSPRLRYKLDITKNQVLALESTQSHRQQMKLWYTISEPHRKALTQLFWDTKKGFKRDVRNV